jgi:hypothetical protein
MHSLGCERFGGAGFDFFKFGTAASVPLSEALAPQCDGTLKVACTAERRTNERSLRFSGRVAKSQALPPGMTTGVHAARFFPSIWSARLRSMKQSNRSAPFG